MCVHTLPWKFSFSAGPQRTLSPSSVINLDTLTHSLTHFPSLPHTPPNLSDMDSESPHLCCHVGLCTANTQKHTHTHTHTPHSPSSHNKNTHHSTHPPL